MVVNYRGVQVRDGSKGEECVIRDPSLLVVLGVGVITLCLAVVPTNPKPYRQTSTAEAAPIIEATAVVEQVVEETPPPVPERKEEKPPAGVIAQVPRPFVPVRGEAVSAKLTVYSCVGDPGQFCPWRNRTYSGTVVAPGTAGCVLAHLGRSFRIEGDPYGIVWTCLDTGLLPTRSSFDLWFYDVREGQGYLANQSSNTVVFVN